MVGRTHVKGQLIEPGRPFREMSSIEGGGVKSAWTFPSLAAGSGVSCVVCRRDLVTQLDWARHTICLRLNIRFHACKLLEVLR